MPAPIRVVVPTNSDDPATWNTALAYAGHIGKQTNVARLDILLLTHTKRQVEITSLAGHLGANAKRLRDGKTMTFSGGETLRHATLQTLGMVARDTVVIAYYADDKMLEKVDSLLGVLGVVAVPWQPNDVDGWKARWDPKVHGQAPSAPTQLIKDPVVERALTSLSSLVNRSHGGLSARDKEHANETLRILRAKGHTLEPENIKSWAIKNNWNVGLADDLGKLAGKIAALKTKPALSGFYNAADRYARWCKPTP